MQIQERRREDIYLYQKEVTLSRYFKLQENGCNQYKPMLSF